MLFLLVSLFSLLRDCPGQESVMSDEMQYDVAWYTNKPVLRWASSFYPYSWGNPQSDVSPLA